MGRRDVQYRIEWFIFHAVPSLRMNNFQLVGDTKSIPRKILSSPFSGEIGVPDPVNQFTWFNRAYCQCTVNVPSFNWCRTSCNSLYVRYSLTREILEGLKRTEYISNEKVYIWTLHYWLKIFTLWAVGARSEERGYHLLCRNAFLSVHLIKASSECGRR